MTPQEVAFALAAVHHMTYVVEQAQAQVDGAKAAGMPAAQLALHETQLAEEKAQLELWQQALEMADPADVPAARDMNGETVQAPAGTAGAEGGGG